MKDSEPRLTDLSHGAGCACKIGAVELSAIRALLPTSSDPDLLVGLAPADDAAVYRVSPDLAVVQTIDFFTPIVDDPFDFGRIAATNALSDIYAMGAKPIMALNVLAFPAGEAESSTLASILEGGAIASARAGIAVAGGHSIDDREPKYGMAVTGVVHPDRILTKAGAEAGDDLYLSKPIGGGVVTTAAMRRLAPTDSLVHCVEVMTKLNADAAIGAIASGAHAATDVTGFGLLGHLRELLVASGLGAVVEAGQVPSIRGAAALADDPRCVSGGSTRNREYAETFTTWGRGVAPSAQTLLTDAMTSGGLLLAIPPGAPAPQYATRIGHLVASHAGEVAVS